MSLRITKSAGIDGYEPWLLPSSDWPPRAYLPGDCPTCLLKATLKALGDP